MTHVTHGGDGAWDAGAMELAGGAFIFLAFVVLYLLAVVHGLYSHSGSGISSRPWRNERMAHEPLAERLARGTR